MCASVIIYDGDDDVAAKSTTLGDKKYKMRLVKTFREIQRREWEKKTFCFWNGVGGAHSTLRFGESKKKVEKKMLVHFGLDMLAIDYVYMLLC